MAKADHIIVPLFGPTKHHGIDIGDGTVVHPTSGMPPEDISLADIFTRMRAVEIRRTPIDTEQKNRASFEREDGASWGSGGGLEGAARTGGAARHAGQGAELRWARGSGLPRMARSC